MHKTALFVRGDFCRSCDIFRNYSLHFHTCKNSAFPHNFFHTEKQLLSNRFSRNAAKGKVIGIFLIFIAFKFCKICLQNIYLTGVK